MSCLSLTGFPRIQCSAQIFSRMPVKLLYNVWKCCAGTERSTFSSAHRTSRRTARQEVQINLHRPLGRFMGSAYGQYIVRNCFGCQALRTLFSALTS